MHSKIVDALSIGEDEYVPIYSQTKSRRLYNAVQEMPLYWIEVTDEKEMVQFLKHHPQKFLKDKKEITYTSRPIAFIAFREGPSDWYRGSLYYNAMLIMNPDEEVTLYVSKPTYDRMQKRRSNE